MGGQNCVHMAHHEQGGEATRRTLQKARRVLAKKLRAGCTACRMGHIHDLHDHVRLSAASVRVECQNGSDPSWKQIRLL